MILAFAPWLAFLVIAHGSLFRLKLGLITALILSIGMGISRLHRGVILWVGLAFFASASIAVIGFNNMWVAKYMGVIAPGVLATATWLTVIFKNPFTMDYAKEHTNPSLWHSPKFIRTNMIVSSAWALTFTINVLLATGKINEYILPDLGYELISYTLMLGTAVFTTWYPGHIRKKAEIIVPNEYN
ncbi:hypothetical protein [Synechococcus sp. CS-603]|uniref:hypothetical protein n=1 Tax=Synechococcus sp. CS-603 TaxID=2847981 RepID=UPI00223B6BBE|nr:hypothetical protein [Synechococcus sp. CS-603]